MNTLLFASSPALAEAPALVISVPLGVSVAVGVYVWVSLALAAVFRKAGQQPGSAWVPLLNAAVLLRLGGQSGWLVAVAIVPVIGALALAVFVIVALQRVNRAFGLGTGMTVLGALVFPVWASVVGWGSARWLPATGAHAPVRRRDTEGGESQVPSLPAAPAAVVGAPSVFGDHGPAGGPDLPPRPPVPTVDGFPSVVPTRAGRSGGAHPRRVDDRDDATHGPPTFRSTMRQTQAGSPPDVRASEPARESVDGPNRAPAGDEDADDTQGSGRQAMPPVAARPAASPWAPAPASVRATLAAQSPVDPLAQSEDPSPATPVTGVPLTNFPRAARSSVSAQHKHPEIPPQQRDEPVDEQIVARRRNRWTLLPTLGSPLALFADVVVIGRRPQRAPDYDGAQLVAVPDETRTVSKTHARLELTERGWTIVDLDSTNGIVLIGDDGTETNAVPGQAHHLTARFLLGDAEFVLRREGR